MNLTLRSSSISNVAEEVAEVEKVLLAGAAFRELRGLPFLDEFVRRQDRGRSSEVTGSAWLKPGDENGGDKGLRPSLKHWTVGDR